MDMLGRLVAWPRVPIVSTVGTAEQHRQSR